MIFSLASSLATFGLLTQCVKARSCVQTQEPATPIQQAQQTEESAEVAAIELDPLMEAQSQKLVAEVKIPVPFTSQAPYKEWVPPYDEACEEASLAMVEFFLDGRTFTPDAASSEIKYLVALEDRYQWSVDISTLQVARLASETYHRKYYRYTGADVSIDNMKKLLAAGYPIILPVAGRELQNSNFQGDGPPYHMIVLTGYNQGNFYAHDPGTQFGEHFEYPQDRLYSSIHEWTGDRSTILEGEKAMLILEQNISYNF